MKLSLAQNKLIKIIILSTLIFFPLHIAQAQVVSSYGSMDRAQVLSQQNELLQHRLDQSNLELQNLQAKHDSDISEVTLEKSSKSLLDKAALDIIVAKSRVANTNMEMMDAEQTISWLEKSIQEIKNQLNVLSVFGLKFARSNAIDEKELTIDLHYQQKLLDLEKNRSNLLTKMQTTAINILSYQNERYNRLKLQLKSYRLLHVKQQQMKDELVYQKLQNQKLQELAVYYQQLDKIDPITAKKDYSNVERNIFYTNEDVNLIHAQTLIARYKDQMEQMKLISMRSSAVSLMNEVAVQAQGLSKQLNNLTSFVQSKEKSLSQHIENISKRTDKLTENADYLLRLKTLEKSYLHVKTSLQDLGTTLSRFRASLDKSIQAELSSRQGLPVLSGKMLLDLGKELLLIPALSFQIVKSLSSHLMQTFTEITLWQWALFALVQAVVLFIYVSARHLLTKMIAKPSSWHNQFNFNWVILSTLSRSFADMFILGDALFILYYFNIPAQNINQFFYLFAVWIIVKAILTVARIYLVETTHDTTGHDVKLYTRLKWMFIFGGIITAFTVYVHQLPLVYELKSLFDRIFLFFLMMVSLLLLRSWHIVPKLILLHSENSHPYLKKSITIIGVLIPALLFANAVIGLFGYLNLVMTIARYEGLFLLVFIGYLILRGLLTDAMHHLSRLTIQHVNNGWLLTEAFIKPIDTVLRLTLFFVAWAFLFLLYGWDRQSPMIEYMSYVLHYPLLNVFSMTITVLSVFELVILISVFYWIAKWTREFIYRMLVTRTKDMGIRNSLAILSQYTVIVIGVFVCLEVLGIDMRALFAVASLLAFGVGLGLRDLANNFACGFLILLERPLRVGDIVTVNNIEGEVTHIGGRAVTVRTWDHMEMMVPNAEIFNKPFTNLTAHDNIVRVSASIKISRYDNPHDLKKIIHNVLLDHKDILKDPGSEVLLREMNDIHMEFQIRYYVNIRQISSRTSVMSDVLMKIWDAFSLNNIKPPYPQHEIFLHSENGVQTLLEKPKI